MLGAGLAGVTTAWYLAKEGHEVLVIDREAQVAAAASYANTGIIAASRAYPWTGGELGRAMRQAALRFDPELWLWGMQHLFLRTGRSYRRVLEAKVRLVRYSQPLLRELAARDRLHGLAERRALPLPRCRGARPGRGARRAMRDHGFSVERLDRAQLAQREPALDVARLAGALYAPGDEVGRRGALLPRARRALPARSASASAWRTRSCRSSRSNASIREVVTRKGSVHADAFVCALGVMDRRLREQLGTHVPVYPVTGFSATLPIVQPEARAAARAIDESRGVALRAAGRSSCASPAARVRRLRRELRAAATSRRSTTR